MTSPIWHTRRAFLRSLALTAGAGALSACSTMAPTSDAVAEPVEYRLGPGDQIRITVFNEPDLTGPFTVGSQGMIAYPLVGSIRASGLTVP